MPAGEIVVEAVASAQDLGDFRNMDELRDAVRKSIFSQRQYEAQSTAKNLIVEKLLAAHEFPAVSRATISLGLARYRTGDDADSLYRRAGEGLSEAKARGHDQAVCI